jgi:NitT/TauT family transport system substrate-binding protein
MGLFSTGAKRRGVALAGVTALVVTLAACGGSTSTGPGGTTLTKATLRLDWSYFPYHEGFLLAQKKGYYKANGIDLTIEEGQGSGTTVTLVGQGKDTFGFADTGTAALQVSKGVPVTVVQVIKRQAGYGFLCFKDLNISTPQQLEGHSVIMVPQESTAQIWPAFVAANNLNQSKIKIVNADFSNKVTLFAARKADCMAGYWAEDAIQAKLIQPNLSDPTKWSDYGIHIFGHGVVVNKDTVKNSPALIKAFLKATDQGFTDMCANLPAAIADYKTEVSNMQDTDKAFADVNLPLECQLMQPPAGDSGKFMGPTSDALWKSMLDTLHQYGGLSPEDAPSAYHTDQFLPSS